MVAVSLNISTPSLESLFNFSKFSRIKFLPILKEASCTDFVQGVSKLSLKNPLACFFNQSFCNPSPVKRLVDSAKDSSIAINT